MSFISQQHTCTGKCDNRFKPNLATSGYSMYYVFIQYIYMYIGQLPQ